MKTELVNLQESKFKGNVLAFGDLKIEDAIIVKGVKVVSGKNGVFLGMPSRKNEKTGEWSEIVYVEDKDLRSQLADLAKANATPPASGGIDFRGAISSPEEPSRSPIDDSDVPF